ncbi:MAG: hypothetical protein ACLFWH_05300 [Actinomycetota bacterium]
MDDVQHRVIVWTLLAAAVIKALTVANVWIAAALLASAAVGFVAPRLGAAGVAVVLTPIVDTNHEMFLFLVAVLVAGFPDTAQRRLLLRTQMTALYLFAGVAKLHPGWLSGELLNRDGALMLFGTLPTGLIVWGTIVAELAMVPLLWWRPRFALYFGAVLHAAIIVGVWTLVPEYRAGLVVFNGLAVAVLFAVMRPTTSPSDSPRRPPLRLR